MYKYYGLLIRGWHYSSTHRTSLKMRRAHSFNSWPRLKCWAVLPAIQRLQLCDIPKVETQIDPNWSDRTMQWSCIVHSDTPKWSTLFAQGCWIWGASLAVSGTRIGSDLPRNGQIRSDSPAEIRIFDDWTSWTFYKRGRAIKWYQMNRLKINTPGIIRKSSFLEDAHGFWVAPQTNGPTRTSWHNLQKHLDSPGNQPEVIFTRTLGLQIDQMIELFELRKNVGKPWLNRVSFT